ncbi:MAG TPA: class I SAM-dependent methyltransferase [Solirubrobacteraceae bacterium]|nr:class I SAM-dependent methyltransferase [Solirubrobacteraceae bacterium]
MAAPASPDAIRDVNTRYHDAAAAEYDHKWGIDFHGIGQGQVLGKLRKALGRRDVGHFPRALEIGAGTGYFSLNLLRAGVIGHATCTDISPGMLATLDRNARRLGLAGRVESVATDAERLPFDDESFDLVLGHAVLHHLPDLDQAFSEFRRVLRPGGTVVFAGEPSRHGDRIAAYPKRGALRVSPLWRRLMRARPAHHGDDGGASNGHAPEATRRLDGHALEPFVDVHAFDPPMLREFAVRAGFADVKVRGEELLANWFGWANRTLESTAEPESVPWMWRQYAYRGYIALQAVDRALLEPRLPAAIFYNLIIAARKPE